MALQSQSSRSQSSLPLLFGNAVPRVSGREIPGQFCQEMSVWAIGKGKNRKPIVEACDADIAEIVTKTDVRQESDDESWSAFASNGSQSSLAEIETKTEVEMESDDEEWSPWLAKKRPSALTDIETKTFVNTESDDEMPSAIVLQDLFTKTLVKQKTVHDAAPRLLRMLLELETKTAAQVEHDDEHYPIL